MKIFMNRTFFYSQDSSNYVEINVFDPKTTTKTVFNQKMNDERALSSEETKKDRWPGEMSNEKDFES